MCTFSYNKQFQNEAGLLFSCPFFHPIHLPLPLTLHTSSRDETSQRSICSFHPNFNNQQSLFWAKPQRTWSLNCAIYKNAISTFFLYVFLFIDTKNSCLFYCRNPILQVFVPFREFMYQLETNTFYTVTLFSFIKMQKDKNWYFNETVFWFYWINLFALFFIFSFCIVQSVRNLSHGIIQDNFVYQQKPFLLVFSILSLVK